MRRYGAAHAAPTAPHRPSPSGPRRAPAPPLTLHGTALAAPPSRCRASVPQVLLLRRIVHPHVIRYYNCFVHGSSLVLVLELAEGGDLQAVVDAARHRGRACEEARAWRILWQLLHVRAHVCIPPRRHLSHRL